MQVNYYIGGIEVNKPLNNKELSIELNFDRDVNAAAVSVTEFEWGLGSQVLLNDAATLINEHKTNGNVFEGLPFRIELVINNTIYNVFDGYLDTSTALYDCDRVVCNAVPRKSVDWLNDVADSVSYDFLYDTGAFDSSYFVDVPYVISTLPNNTEALLGLISLSFIIDTINSEMNDFLQKFAEATNPFELTALVRIVIHAVYIAALITSAILLIKRIINLLIQPVKYHSGMYALDLCTIGAAHFGLTFESTILQNAPYNKMVIIPEKYNQDVNDRDANNNKIDDILGFLSPNNPESRGQYKGTFGDLLRGLKQMFNAKIIIQNGVLKLEREDYNNSAYNYILPPVNQTSYRLNSEDFKANYTVSFQVDYNDKNTAQYYEGVATQVITSPKTYTNKDMLLMKGLEQRNIPFARGHRKEDLTSVEKIVRDLAVVLDPVLSTASSVINIVMPIIETYFDAYSTVINYNPVFLPFKTIFVAVTGTPFSFQAIIDYIEDKTGINTGVNLNNLPRINYTPIGQLIENRVGMLMLENDFIDIPKILLIDESSTPRNTNVSTINETYINSEYLMLNYHFVRNFVPSSTKPNANQYLIYNVTNVPFTCADYLLLLNSNYMKDSDLRNGEIVSCKWNVEQQVAEIEYKINQLYANNFKQNLITPNGK